MTAIEFNNISKQYRLGLVSTGTLCHDLNRFFQTKILHREDPYLKIGETNDRSVKGKSEYVWALKDINFKVEQGDVVGIIGRNGAGKSTLLKLLSRVTSPTTGSIHVRGRIASLLEVGTGFHPEMTGRENIYMNGAIMGMTQREIDRKLDEIVDFSGCERYLDTPVKRYSSGMSVRLGFAIAAHLEPEILVVDEVLAVGDVEFQKKAIGKMKDVAQGQGRTVLFVSHNMPSIRSLCQRAVVLENGMIAYLGDVTQGIDFYTQANKSAEVAMSVADAPRSGRCSNLIRFMGLRLLNELDEEADPHCGRTLKVEVAIDVAQDSRNCDLTVGFHDVFDRPVYMCDYSLTQPGLKISKGHHIAVLTIPKLALTQGLYLVQLYASVGGARADFIRNAMRMNVVDDDYFGTGRMVNNSQKGIIVLCEHFWVLN